MVLFNLSGAQYRTYLTLFNSIQHNGLIGKQEIRAILSTRGIEPTIEQLQKMIDLVSVNSLGINLQGFIDYTSAWQSFRDVEGEMEEAFRIYDRTGSGQLSRDDIEYVMKKVGARIDVQALMDDCDKNRDGFIQFDEFVDLMKNKYS